MRVSPWRIDSTLRPSNFRHFVFHNDQIAVFLPEPIQRLGSNSNVILRRANSITELGFKFVLSEIETDGSCFELTLQYFQFLEKIYDYGNGMSHTVWLIPSVVQTVNREFFTEYYRVSFSAIYISCLENLSKGDQKHCKNAKHAWLSLLRYWNTGIDEFVQFQTKLI